MCMLILADGPVTENLVPPEMVPWGPNPSGKVIEKFGPPVKATYKGTMIYLSAKRNCPLLKSLTRGPYLSAKRNGPLNYAHMLTILNYTFHCQSDGV